MRIAMLQFLEVFFGALESFASKMRERCAVCPDCGRNRYTGEACVSFEKLGLRWNRIVLP